MTWESNNPAVATVDTNGKVTGVKAGTATITAASEADAAKTAELKVTVTEVKADDATLRDGPLHRKQQGYAEKIYLDISRGDDATQWDTLNGGEPILVSTNPPPACAIRSSPTTPSRRPTTCWPPIACVRRA